MTLNAVTEGYRTLPQHLRAAARPLLRTGIWLSVIGIACAGGAYLEAHHAYEAPDAGSLMGVMGLAGVAIGIVLLLLGAILRTIARLWKGSSHTA